MENPIDKNSIGNIPVLWGLLGILISGVCNSLVNILFSVLEMAMTFAKADMIFLKLSTLASGIVPVLLILGVAIIFIGKFRHPKPINKVWVVVLLILWPLLSFAGYYLSMAISPMRFKSIEFDQIKEMIHFRTIAIGIETLGYTVIIIASTIYLLVSNPKPKEL